MQRDGFPHDFYDALRRVFFASDKPLKALADDLGIPEKTLYGMADPENRGQLKARDVGRVTRLTGNTALIEWLCRACGGCFVPDPDLGQPLPVEVVSEIANASRELGELATLAIEEAQRHERAAVNGDAQLLIISRVRKLSGRLFRIGAAVSAGLAFVGCSMGGMA